MIELDLKVWENFSELGVIEDLPAEHVIKESGSIEKHMTFLLTGSGGNLIWQKNNYICTELAAEGEILMDYISFTLQKPTNTEVRLFTESKIFKIPHYNFLKTFNKGASGTKVTIKVLEEAYIEKEQRQIDLLSKTAKERYIELVDAKKNIDMFPLKYLASYLGITPQSLSRIRNQKI